MSKLQISMQGSIDELINELSIVMLQRERIKNIVLGAAVRVINIEGLKAKIQAENIALQMKEMIQKGGGK